MSIISEDTFIKGLAAGDQFFFSLTSGTTVAGFQYHLNRLCTPNTFGQAAIPTAYSSGGQINTKATLGYPTFPSVVSPTELYISNLNMLSSVIGNYAIHDELWSCSGFSGTVVTAQTVVSAPALTRYTDGIGNHIYIVCYTATGTTATTCTIKYTNQAGTANRTATVAIPASMTAGRMIQATLQAGDQGVLSVQSVQLTATTGTAGNFGVSITHPLTNFVTVGTSNLSHPNKYDEIGLTKVDTNAALLFQCLANGTASGNITGSLKLAEA